METDRSIKDMGLDVLRFQAYDLGWAIYSYDAEQKKIRLTRGETKIDIWLTKKSTVAVMKKDKPAVYYRYVVEHKLQDILSQS